MATLYLSLAPSKIRLLSFVDETGTNCTLEEASLNEAPLYACLSYAWRDGETGEAPVTHHTISINEQTKLVRRNLHDALSHLGPVARSKGHKFWVDAICINQDDIEERAEQVKLMKRIYEQAETVMAWTGPATPNTELAFGMMQAISTFDNEYFIRHTQRTALNLWQAAISRQPFFQDRPKGDVLIAWAEMVQIFKRAYWERAWVHQEITGDNSVFHCGLRFFTWRELHAFDSFHATYGGLRDMPDKYMLMLSGGVNIGSPFFDLLVAKKNRAAISTSAFKDRRLMDLIRELRLTHCSDARDKVFAAFPHATDIDASHAKEVLKVDYSQSVRDTYIGVVRYYLQDGNLEILGYIGADCTDLECRPPRRADEQALPSWVPDWRNPYRIRPLNTGRRSHRAYRMLYDPLPNTTARLEMTASELRVQAICFDTLRNTVTSTGREYVPSELKVKWGKHMKAWSPTLTSRDIKRILNGDVQWTSDETGNVRGEVIDWEFLDDPIEKLREEHRPWRHNMRHVLRSVCRDRRAGRTKANRIGIFPEMALTSDIIAAFHGGHALYVVRPVQQRLGVYQFIGECYVDGIMDGQVLELVKKERLSTTTMTLI